MTAGNLYVSESRNRNKGVFTTTEIAAGDLILVLKGVICEYPDKYTIQLGRDIHLSAKSGIQDFINHSCSPNCAIDNRKRILYAIKPISSGEELTFDYCTTEKLCAVPFLCNCGAANCYGTVRGFTCLNDEQKRRIAGYAASYLYEPALLKK